MVHTILLLDSDCLCKELILTARQSNFPESISLKAGISPDKHWETLHCPLSHFPSTGRGEAPKPYALRPVGWKKHSGTHRPTHSLRCVRYWATEVMRLGPCPQVISGKERKINQQFQHMHGCCGSRDVASKIEWGDQHSEQCFLGQVGSLVHHPQNLQFHKSTPHTLAQLANCLCTELMTWNSLYGPGTLMGAGDTIVRRMRPYSPASFL